MGTHLGTFGKDVEPTDSTFEYFGAIIRVNPEFCELDLVDFVEAAAKVDETSPESMTMLKTFFRALLAADDFDTFWALAKRNRQGVQALAEVSQGIIAGLAGRPTTPPSDSSDGRQTTAITSAADGWTPEGREALTALQGRPDLQMHVLRREEALAAGR